MQLVSYSDATMGSSPIPPSEGGGGGDWEGAIRDELKGHLHSIE